MCLDVDFSGLRPLLTNCAGEGQILFQDQQDWWRLYVLRQIKGCIWEVEFDVGALSTELQLVLTMGQMLCDGIAVINNKRDLAGPSEAFLSGG